jgi:hypothetical protein
MGVFEFLSDDEISGANVDLEKLLPFVHTTLSCYAMDILQQMKLEKKPCNKFKDENLLYFYYARPAYRKIENQTTSDKSLAPVVLIIEPILDDIKRIFPFDSGVYDKYTEIHLSSRAKLSDYELPKTLQDVQFYINAIFGSNHNYCVGKIRMNNELPIIIQKQRQTNHSLDNLLNLFSKTNKDDLDDRRFTVEIQSANDFFLSGKLLAVIAPNFYEGDENFVRILIENNARSYYYEYYEWLRVNEHTIEVYNRTRNYYKEQGYISGENYEC